MYRPPILGFDDRDYAPTLVTWADGTPLGILSLASDPEIEARLEAERARKEELRSQPNVVLLEDWRQND